MSASFSYALWLPSWYPCRLAPYDGDFIQRHARAVSACLPVHVVHFIRDQSGSITKTVLTEQSTRHHLTETIIYYYSPPSRFILLDRFRSFHQYKKVYKNYLTHYFEQNGIPSLVHVHIAFKAGLIARWIKRKTGINYLLTEQWTVFLPEAKPGFKNLSLIARYLIGKIFSGALRILPVSDYLAASLRKRWPEKSYEVVPNVVDTTLFYPEENVRNDKLQLIHISTLTYQKDPDTLFSALGILKKKGIDFSLHLIGPVHKNLYFLINKEGIEKNINLLGEMPQAELASWLRKSDALILYSRYETFGCVIIEANACGIPVIVPDTPLMQELVQDGLNGLLVQPGSASALADALERYSQCKNNFSKSRIASAAAERYNFTRVGKQIADIYFRSLEG